MPYKREVELGDGWVMRARDFLSGNALPVNIRKKDGAPPSVWGMFVPQDNGELRFSPGGKSAEQVTAIPSSAMANATLLSRLMWARAARETAKYLERRATALEATACN